jgi:hypothetical protein
MALNALHFTPASSMQNMSNTMRNINAEDRRGSLHKRQNKSIHSTLFLHEGHIVHTSAIQHFSMLRKTS